MMLNCLNGFPIIADDYLVDQVQARKNKRKRINKKWLKKYGYKHVPSKQIFVFDNKIYAHSKMVDFIKNKYSKELR